MKMEYEKQRNREKRRSMSKSPTTKILNNIKQSPSTSNNFKVIDSNDASPTLSEKALTKYSPKNKLDHDDADNKQHTKKSKIQLSEEETFMENNPVYENVCDISFVNTVELLLDRDTESESEDNFQFSGSSAKLFNESQNNSMMHSFNLFETEIKTVQCNNISILEAENGMLIILKQDCIYIHGATKLSILKGRVDILGHLIEENETFDVYSPRGSSFLYINKLQHTSKLNISKVMHIVNTKAVLIKNFLKNVKEEDTLIFCQLVDNKLISTLEKYVPQQLFPKNDIKCKIIDDLKDINVMNISPSWNDLICHVQTNSRILITGGKGVGKSTLLRFIVNKLLSKYKKILVVDLDPGQAEFTIPGCVSSVMVTKPLLGPNYTHLQKPERCFYIPNISILQSPLEYIECIKKLMSCYEDYTQCPMIMNSIGYARNLASELLSSIIGITSPSAIFQINSQNFTKNCHVNVNLDAIKRNLTFFSPGVEMKRNFKIYKIDAPSDECVAWICGPRQLREMCIFSYFSQMLGVSSSFTSGEIPTYMISLHSIKIISPNTLNPLAVANGSLVSLCSTSSECSTATKIYECQGWGIVRAIDLKMNILYLNTPLDQEELQQVKYVIVGSVKIPSSIYTTMDGVSGVQPYISHGFESIFSQAPKRAYIPKK